MKKNFIFFAERISSLKFKHLEKKGGGFLRLPMTAATLRRSVYLELLIKSTIALNASGWFAARSAKALRFSSIPLLWISPMKAE